MPRILHPLRLNMRAAQDKRRHAAHLLKLTQRAQLPERQHFQCDPYGRRGAAWRVGEYMAETERMCEKVTRLGRCGTARRTLHKTVHENSLERMVDPEMDLAEMVWDCKKELQAGRQSEEDDMMEALMAERAIIRAQLQDSAERARAGLLEARTACEGNTSAVIDLAAR